MSKNKKMPSEVVSDIWLRDVKENGLYMYQFAVGMGKTTAAREYVIKSAREGRKDLKIIYLSSSKEGSKKNFFEKVESSLKESDLYTKDYIVYLDNQEDRFFEFFENNHNISSTISSLHELDLSDSDIKLFESILNEIKSDIECSNEIKNLSKDRKNKSKASYYKSMMKDISEKRSRHISDLINLVSKEDKISEENINKILDDESLSWLKKLFPELIAKYRATVIVCTFDKFISPLSAPGIHSDMLATADFVDNAFILIDEADSTKKRLLNSILKKQLPSGDLQVCLKILAPLFISELSDEESVDMFTDRVIDASGGQLFNCRDRIREKVKNLYTYPNNNSRSFKDYYNILNLDKPRKAEGELYVNTKNNGKHLVFTQDPIGQFTVINSNDSKDNFKNIKRPVEILNKDNFKNIKFSKSSDIPIYTAGETIYGNEEHKSYDDYVYLQQVEDRMYSFFTRAFIPFIHEIGKLSTSTINSEPTQKQLENEITSILSKLGIDKSSESASFILECCKANFIKGTRPKNKDSYNFFTDGFSSTHLIYSEADHHQTYVKTSSVLLTPESFLVSLARRCKVICFSATLQSESLVGNYHIPYLKEQLGKQYHDVTENSFEEINKSIKNATIPQNITYTLVDKKDKDSVLRNIFTNSELLQSALNSFKDVADKYSEKDPDEYRHKLRSEIVEFCNYIVKERYLFITDKEKDNHLVSSGIIFGNKLFNKYDEQFVNEILKYLCYQVVEDYGNKNVLEELLEYFSKDSVYVLSSEIINSKGSSCEKDHISWKESCSKNDRFTLILSTYSTNGRGYDDLTYDSTLPIDYPECFNKVLNREVSSSGDCSISGLIEKDFDCALLLEPTNVLPLGDDFPDKSIGDVYNAHQLLASEEISEATALSMIRASMCEEKYVPKGNGCSSKPINTFFHESNTIAIQAIGRLLRTPIRSKGCQIWIDSELAGNCIISLERSKIEKEILRPEIASFYDFIRTEAPRNPGKVKMMEIEEAAAHMDKANKFTNRVLSNWIHGNENEGSKTIYDGENEQRRQYEEASSFLLGAWPNSKEEFNDLPYYIKQLFVELESPVNSYTSIVTTDSIIKGSIEEFSVSRVDYSSDVDEKSNSSNHNQKGSKELSWNKPELVSNPEFWAKNPKIKEYFDKNGIVFSRRDCLYVPTPTALRNLIQGRIGEKVAEACFDSNFGKGVLKPQNREFYEKQDYEFNADIAVDVKNWAGDINDRDFFEKAVKKAKDANRKVVYYINTVSFGPRDKGFEAPYVDKDTGIKIYVTHMYKKENGIPVLDIETMRSLRKSLEENGVI